VSDLVKLKSNKKVSKFILMKRPRGKKYFSIFELNGKTSFRILRCFDYCRFAHVVLPSTSIRLLPFCLLRQFANDEKKLSLLVVRARAAPQG